MNPATSRLLDLAIAIQQIPAPTFHEAARAGFVRARFLEEGLTDVETDAAGNVYACLKPAHAPSSVVHGPLVVSAHLDTVFPPSVDLAVTREPERILGPGIGDNALGVAGLFGLVWTLRERGLSLPGEVWLVANTCEEGLGDLRGMRLVADRFGVRARAYLVLEGMALGQVYHRGLGVRRCRVSVSTEGGHSWIDYGQPSAIHELTAISSRITALSLPRLPRTSLNIGVISGGSSVNTIAAEASLELDLRSEDASTLDALFRQVEEIVRTAEKPGVTAVLEVIGSRPWGEISASHPLVCLGQDCLRAAGVEPRLNIGSTDANLPLSRGLPAITMGLTTGGKGHTVHEFINLPPLERGMDSLTRLVSRVWEGGF